MFDFSFGELAVIGTVALVVLGPERLPRVARTVGEWVGKAQRYVSQVKSDINREIELAELKKLQEEARQAAQSVQSSLNEVNSDLASLETAAGGPAGSTAGPGEDAPDGYAWEGTGESWRSSVFPKRYRPGPSVDELAEELARLKRQMALPSAHAGTSRKYAPRARVNRPRIRR
ncbi:MAG: twin-arginine translocase subunit TatB [Burkholderiales bacterium]|nr:MAG: twin-arginine translocase subunit TatB [Burkholderiales bacterium]